MTLKTFTQDHTVLLVEDSDNDVVLMQRAWRTEKVSAPLRIVTDGRMAIDYLGGSGNFSDRALHPLPRLMLLDLKLPYIHGLDVLKWLRAQPALKILPVLVLTTSNLQGDVEQAYDVGANCFLIKPSNVHELSALVRLIRDFWLGLSQLPQIGVAPEMACR